MRHRWIRRSTIAAVVVALLTASGYCTYRSSAVWERHSPFDRHSIRLLPLGIAIVQGWCDVCPITSGLATWKRASTDLIVRSFGSNKPLKLRRISSEPCVMYMEVESYRRLEGYNPLAAYVQTTDKGCPNGAPMQLPEQL
jgi:hypothetical protein